MPDNIKIGVIGGDRRQTVVAERLGKRYECAAWGLERVPDCAVRCADWKDAARGAGAVILPLPVTRDGENLNSTEIPLGEICSLLHEGVLLCSGMIPRSVHELAEERGAEVFDYYESESVQIRNAVPTAEGTIAALIGEMPVTIDGMTVVVTGYGRCARTLAKKLILLGAVVYAAARSEKDLSWAEVDGCVPIALKDYCEFPLACDAVVNTVPVKLFDGQVLEGIDPRTTLFDLTNGCAGIDTDAAERLGIKVVPLPSLPGKTSPETAGNIIADAVTKRICEHTRKAAER